MSQGQRQVRAENVERVGVDEARRDVEAGRALLVCAYDDEEKCAKARLENAITLKDLQRRVESVPRNQSIIFYCA